MKTPHLHLIRAQGAAPKACWALQLESCPAERAKLESEEAVLARQLREGMELLRALVAARAEANDTTFALRYIFHPDAANFAAGRAQVALIGQSSAPDAADARAVAASLCAESLALLGGALPDHVWRVAQNKAEFTELWRPFAPKYVAEIRRRESALDLPALVTRPSLGRVSESAAQNDVVGVHPFAPHPARLSQLLRVFLLQDQPLVWQITFAPARLSDEEVAAMRAQIARCEAAQFDGRDNRNFSAKSASEVPEYLVKSAAQGLAQSLARLQSAPLLMNVAVWGALPLAPSIVEACGALTSAAEEPARGSSHAATLGAGGFRAALPDGASELKIARRNATHLEFASWGATALPDSLARLAHLAHAEEAGAALRWPNADSGGAPGLNVKATRVRPLPRALAARDDAGTAGFSLGVNRYLGGEQAVALSPADRSGHLYLSGQTGTGKSTLLKSLALADMRAGRGVAVVDPHGDLFAELLELVPPHRRDDVIVIDPTDMENPVGLNLLEYRDEAERYFIVREMRGMMERLINDQYQGHAGLMTGPMFYLHVQMNLLLAMSDPDDPGTLLEFYEIFGSKDYWKRWLPLCWSDARLRNWVKNTLPKTDYRHAGSENVALGDYMSSKFEDFLFDPRLRLMFGQKRSGVDLRRVMDEGKILLVNLAKGQLSEANARFLGMILMAKFQSAAMSRIELQPSERRPFSLFVDEFQSLATENFSLMLSEARKFGISLTLANQFVSQIKDPAIAQSIFGNVGTLVTFRVGRADAELLAPLYQPQFDADDLVNLPNWNACVKTTVNGQIAAPFSLQTQLPTAAPDAQLARELKAASTRTYGRPRAEVEAEIALGFEATRPMTPAQELRAQEIKEQTKARAEAAASERARENKNARDALAGSLFGSVAGANLRHHPVLAGQEFVLDNPKSPEAERTLRTLDDLGEAINLIDPDVFKRHVNEESNDFADWVENAFDLPDLAVQLRKYPTPLRMMVSIEKFLRQSNLPK